MTTAHLEQALRNAGMIPTRIEERPGALKNYFEVEFQEGSKIEKVYRFDLVFVSQSGTAYYRFE